MTVDTQNATAKTLGPGDRHVEGRLLIDDKLKLLAAGETDVELTNNGGELSVNGNPVGGEITIADVTGLQDALDAVSFREFASFTSGTLTDAQVVLSATVGIGGGTLLSGGTNCYAYAGIAPTVASEVLTIKKVVPGGSTTTLGTITITTGGAVTFAVSGDKTLAAGNLIVVVNQETANATAGDLNLLLNLAS